MDLQLFYRDTEHADAVMTKQEVVYIFQVLFDKKTKGSEAVEKRMDLVKHNKYTNK